MADSVDPATDDTAPELTETELTALHHCQLGIEHVHRAYGSLLDFHHRVGHAMDRFDEAERTLRAAGHDELADELRDRHLPAGVVDGRWSYEVVEAFEREFRDPVVAFEAAVRERLADGRGHVTERRQQRRWRERAGRGSGSDPGAGSAAGRSGTDSGSDAEDPGDAPAAGPDGDDPGRADADPDA
jgi:hypothetical protein